MTSAKWAWQDERGNWNDYDSLQSKTIEDAYNTGKKTATMKVNRNTHIVNVLEQKLTIDGASKVLRIKRNSSGRSSSTPANLNEAQQVFDKFKAVGIKQGGDPAVDAIQGHGFIAMSEELGIDVQDIVMLYLAWKAEAQVPYQISRAEWYHCMAVLNADSIKKLKAMLPTFRKNLQSSTSEFKEVYHFVFPFVREDERHNFLSVETATEYWKLLLGNRWHWVSHWCDFISQVHKKSVSKDVWKQTLEFSQVVVSGFDDYDADTSAWPTVMDEFVEHLRVQGIAKRLRKPNS